MQKTTPSRLLLSTPYKTSLRIQQSDWSKGKLVFRRIIYIRRARVGAPPAGRSRDGRGRPNSTVPSFRARAVCDPVPAAAASMLGDRPIESAGSRANHSIGYHDQPCVHAQGTVHNHAVLSPPCSTTHPPAPPFIAYRIANGWLARPLGAISTPRRPRHDMWSCPACLPACRRDRRIILEPHAHVACVAQPWNTLFHGTTTQHHHPCCPGGGTRVRRGLFEGMGGADRGGLPVGVGEREQYRPAIGPF